MDKDIVKVCRVWYNKKCLLIVGPVYRWAGLVSFREVFLCES
ncbi:protein of unknown function [Ruminococcaceae bacterium BL-4]|nr:protein of unknown function [Ruminococcaceae bacterium BL-4]